MYICCHCLPVLDEAAINVCRYSKRHGTVTNTEHTFVNGHVWYIYDISSNNKSTLSLKYLNIKYLKHRYITYVLRLRRIYIVYTEINLIIYTCIIYCIKTDNS